MLERFIFTRDESAFTALVERHGPMVRGVCRRVLGDEQDAEDAFQATFLVLARRADTVRAGSLPSWLYGVALRVARKARTTIARRRRREQAVEPAAPDGPGLPGAVEELRTVLDEELGRLPEKYRAPLVLCYLEGMTKDEAALQLGWPSGTVSGRMARARDLLRGRLERRGLALSAALFTTTLLENAAPAAVPVALRTLTVAAALRFVGQPANLAQVTTPSVASLVRGVLHDMMLTKFKIVGGLLVVVALFAAGTGVFRQTAEAAPLAKTNDKPDGKADAPKADAKPIRFSSTQHFEVSEFVDGVNPHHLGTTPAKTVSIPASAEWYVTPQNQAARPGGGGGNFGGGFPGGVGGFGGGAGPVVAPPKGGNMPAPGVGALGAPAAGGGGQFGNLGAPPAGVANPFGGALGQALPMVQAGQLPRFTKKELTTLVDELKKKDVPGLSIDHRDFLDEDLAALASLPALQTLLLHHTKITDAGLKCLADFPALRTLVLESEDLTDEGIAHLAKIKGLKVLHLAKVQITDKAFDSLKDCASLQSILVMGCPEVSDKGIAKLVKMDNVKAVRLMDMAKITDEGIASIKEMKGLTTLQLEWCPEITDKGIEALKGFYHVENLRIRLLNLSADGLAHLKAVPGLKKLELLYQEGTQGFGMGGFGVIGAGGQFGPAKPVPVGGGGFGNGMLTPVQSVYAPNESPAATRQKVGKLTDAVLKGLKDAVTIEELAVGGDELTNDGLAVLSSLKGLKKAHLGGKELSGAALKHLKDLTDLNLIDIVGVGPKDEAIAAAAGELKGLAQLEKVQLSSHVTKVETAKVTRALAKVKVEALEAAPVDGIIPGQPEVKLPKGGAPGFGGVGGFGGAGGIGGFPAPPAR